MLTQVLPYHFSICVVPEQKAQKLLVNFVCVQTHIHTHNIPHSLASNTNNILCLLLMVIVIWKKRLRLLREKKVRIFFYMLYIDKNHFDFYQKLFLNFHSQSLVLSDVLWTVTWSLELVKFLRTLQYLSNSA